MIVRDISYDQSWAQVLRSGDIFNLLWKFMAVVQRLSIGGTYTRTSWKHFLRNCNMDITRSKDFLPKLRAHRAVCTYEDPVFLAYNVLAWNSYRSLGRAIRVSRLSSNLSDSTTGTRLRIAAKCVAARIRGFNK